MNEVQSNIIIVVLLISQTLSDFVFKTFEGGAFLNCRKAWKFDG